MKIKKSSILLILSTVIGLGIYNTCVFLLVNEWNSTIWMTYLFTTLAFIIGFVLIVAFKKSPELKGNLVLGLPPLVLSGIYFALQMVVGIAIMVIAPETKLAVVIQVLILAVFLLIVIAAFGAKSHIIKAEAEAENASAFIRNLTMKAENLYNAEIDMGRKAELKKVFEAVKYSDPMSSTQEIRFLDKEIADAFFRLQDSIGDVSTEQLQIVVKPILDLIAKRNALCRKSK